jgi:hypothetical protein
MIYLYFSYEPKRLSVVPYGIPGLRGGDCMKKKVFSGWSGCSYEIKYKSILGEKLYGLQCYESNNPLRILKLASWGNHLHQSGPRIGIYREPVV